MVSPSNSNRTGWMVREMNNVSYILILLGAGLVSIYYLIGNGSEYSILMGVKSAC